MTFTAADIITRSSIATVTTTTTTTTINQTVWKNLMVPHYRSLA
jgi:hypothetical protein